MSFKQLDTKALAERAQTEFAGYDFDIAKLITVHGETLTASSALKLSSVGVPLGLVKKIVAWAQKKNAEEQKESLHIAEEIILRRPLADKTNLRAGDSSQIQRVSSSDAPVASTIVTKSSRASLSLQKGSAPRTGGSSQIQRVSSSDAPVASTIVTKSSRASFLCKKVRHQGLEVRPRLNEYHPLNQRNPSPSEIEACIRPQIDAVGVCTTPVDLENCRRITTQIIDQISSCAFKRMLTCEIDEDVGCLGGSEAWCALCSQKYHLECRKQYVAEGNDWLKAIPSEVCCEELTALNLAKNVYDDATLKRWLAAIRVSSRQEEADGGYDSGPEDLSEGP